VRVNRRLVIFLSNRHITNCFASDRQDSRVYGAELRGRGKVEYRDTIFRMAVRRNCHGRSWKIGGRRDRWIGRGNLSWGPFTVGRTHLSSRRPILFSDTLSLCLITLSFQAVIQHPSPGRLPNRATVHTRTSSSRLMRMRTRRDLCDVTD